MFQVGGITHHYPHFSVLLDFSSLNVASWPLTRHNALHLPTKTSARRVTYFLNNEKCIRHFHSPIIFLPQIIIIFRLIILCQRFIKGWASIKVWKFNPLLFFTLSFGITTNLLFYLIHFLSFYSADFILTGYIFLPRCCCCYCTPIINASAVVLNNLNLDGRKERLFGRRKCVKSWMQRVK